MSMTSRILEALKNLYLKISCALCCKSKCAVQVGRNEQEPENSEN